MGIDLDRLSPAAKAQILKKLGIEQKEREEKLHNRKVKRDGIWFASEREADRYTSLKLLQRAGAISGLQMQVKYPLIPAQKKPSGGTERACSYVADFVYQRDGKTVVEDSKGYRDPHSATYAKFAIKRKLMLWVHGIEVKEV